MDNVNSGYLNRFKSFPLTAFSCETKDLALKIQTINYPFNQAQQRALHSFHIF
jgi:hypothetical protein